MTTAVQDRRTPPAEGTWRDPRAFVDPQVWDREIKLLVRDNPFDTVMAERLFGQAIAYLITAMEKHGQQLGSVHRTSLMIQANGFQVDWPLWEKDFTKCTPCHPGSNCH